MNNEGKIISRAPEEKASPVDGDEASYSFIMFRAILANGKKTRRIYNAGLIFRMIVRLVLRRLGGFL